MSSQAGTLHRMATKMFRFVINDPYLAGYLPLKVHNWIDQLGDKPLYSDSELLTLPLSNTIKGRIPSMKEGSVLFIRHRSRGVDIYIQRVTEEDVSAFETEESLRASYAAVNKQIEDAVPELFCKKRKIEKDLRASEKALKKRGLT